MCRASGALVADISIFYSYFQGHYSLVIKNVIPDPVNLLRWERDCRELVRFGLLMRRIALSWTLTRRFRSTTPEMGAVLQRRTNLGFVYS